MAQVPELTLEEAWRIMDETQYLSDFENDEDTSAHSSTSKKREQVGAFSCGDLVFAKVRYYPPWPARVENIAAKTSKHIKYSVSFFGSSQSGVCKESDLFPYAETKTKYEKSSKAKNFLRALSEIEEAVSLMIRDEENGSDKTEDKKEEVVEGQIVLLNDVEEGKKDEDEDRNIFSRKEEKEKGAYKSTSETCHYVEDERQKDDEIDTESFYNIEINKTDLDSKVNNAPVDMHHTSVKACSSHTSSHEGEVDTKSVSLSQASSPGSVRDMLFQESNFRVDQRSSEKRLSSQYKKLSTVVSSPTEEAREDIISESESEEFVAEDKGKCSEFKKDLNNSQTLEVTISREIPMSSSEDTSLVQALRIGLFSCRICGKCFHKKVDLENHWLVHSNERQFQCSKCKETFKRKDDLTVHMKIHYGKACSICSRTFMSIGQFCNHMRNHGVRKPFSCKKCEKSFTSRGQLTMHMSVHIGERPYKCHLCVYTFRLKKHLIEHMRTHTGERPFKCEQCGKAFSRKCTLTCHMRTHSHHQVFNCRKCLKVFSKRTSLIQHRLKDHQNRCDVCNETFSTSQQMVDHKCAHNDEKPFKCHKCRETFTVEQLFLKHMSTHTQNELSKCDKCGKIFRNSKAFAGHAKVHNGKRPDKYGEYADKFPVKRNLLKHLNYHADEQLVQG